MDRRHRRARLHRQVRRLSPRQQQGLPHHRRDQQDLDLFRMPSTCASRPTARPKTSRSTSSAPTRSTSSTPSAARAASPSTPTTGCSRARPTSQVRVAILKGQQLVAQGDLTGALAEYQKALDANPHSSLASYRIGEVLFMQRNYQASANTFRDALRGDDDPRWTEVWSHIQLGKIFDVTGQRDRAVNEYRLAVQTNDNTQGAINEARLSCRSPTSAPTANKPVFAHKNNGQPPGLAVSVLRGSCCPLLAGATCPSEIPPDRPWPVPLWSLPASRRRHRRGR